MLRHLHFFNLKIYQFVDLGVLCDFFLFRRNNFLWSFMLLTMGVSQAIFQINLQILLLQSLSLKKLLLMLFDRGQSCLLYLEQYIVNIFFFLLFPQRILLFPNVKSAVHLLKLLLSKITIQFSQFISYTVFFI